MKQFEKKENDFLKLKLTEYEQELTHLRELVHQLMRSHYGRSKETLPDDNQLNLFDDPTTKQTKAGRLKTTSAESDPTIKKNNPNRWVEKKKYSNNLLRKRFIFD